MPPSVVLIKYSWESIKKQHQVKNNNTKIISHTSNSGRECYLTMLTQAVEIQFFYLNIDKISLMSFTAVHAMSAASYIVLEMIITKYDPMSKCVSQLSVSSILKNMENI